MARVVEGRSELSAPHSEVNPKMAVAEEASYLRADPASQLDSFQNGYTSRYMA